MKKPLLVVWAVLGFALLGIWLYLTPAGILGKADAVGYAVCSRNPAHSFFFGARQMPLCARCTGTQTGLLLTLFTLWWAYPRRSGFPPLGVQITLGLLAAAFALDGANSWLTDATGSPFIYTPNNVFRLFSGLGMGAAIGAILYPIANQTLWEQSDPRRVLGWKGFAALMGGITAMGALILTGNPTILLPIALLSTVDVGLALTLIYTLLVITITKQEGLARRWSDLTLHLAAGATLAFLQIALFDAARFALTGTWGYFPY